MQVFDFPPSVMRTWPTALTFSPDGRFMVVSAWNHQVLDTNEGRWLDPLAERDHHDVRFVLGGRAIAYLDYVTAVAVADFGTRAVARRYELEQASGRGLVAAPDGRTLYLLAHLFDAPKGAAVWRFDAETLERRGEFAWQKENPWEMIGSADARRLATGRVVRSNEIRVWATDDPDRPPVTVAPKAPGRFALSADGGHLATVGSRGVTLWDAATGAEVWSSGKHRRSVTMTAFSPTRPLLATGDNAGTIFLWDFAGRVLVRYDFGLGDVSGLAFAPDGLRCAAAGGSKLVVWDVDV